MYMNSSFIHTCTCTYHWIKYMCVQLCIYNIVQDYMPLVESRCTVYLFNVVQVNFVSPAFDGSVLPPSKEHLTSLIHPPPIPRTPHSGGRGETPLVVVKDTNPVLSSCTQLKSQKYLKRGFS